MYVYKYNAAQNKRTRPEKNIKLCKYFPSLKTQVAVLSGVTLILRYLIETYVCAGIKSFI